MYCKVCHKELHDLAEICPNCGVRNRLSSEKHPELSAVLSFIFPGFGQSYNGKKLKSISFFAIGLSLLFIDVIAIWPKTITTFDHVIIIGPKIVYALEHINSARTILAIGDVDIDMRYILYPAFWLYNIYDAQKGAKLANNNI